MPSFTVAEIARRIEGAVIGDPALQLNGFAPANAATEGHLTFAENKKYFEQAQESGASAILVPEGTGPSRKTLICVKNPRLAFARVLPLFFPERSFPAGVHPSAIVAASATIDPSAHVGPHCVIGERVCIGARSVLMGGNHIGDDSRLGEDVWLFPNVVLYGRSQLGNRVRVHAGTIIGSDGYGYVFDAGQHRKVMQIGNVIIHDDVEIGSNACIDRGALGSTVIGRGTKIDNLVQIAHNVVVGEGCLLVGQSGYAGSTRLGNYVVVAAQVGIAGHLRIGNQVTIAAKSGVMHDIPDGEKWLGIPAGPDLEMKRQWIGQRRLPELLKRVAELEKQVAALTGKPKVD